MLHPVGWGASHHLSAKWRGIFGANTSCLPAQNQEWATLEWAQLPAKQERQFRNLHKIGQKRFSGEGCRCTSKQNLAGLWSNNDSELSQEINAQNGTSHYGLQKMAVKNVCPETGRFFKQIPPPPKKKGIGCPSAPFRRGPDRASLDMHGTILNVAPVSTIYLLLLTCQ